MKKVSIIIPIYNAADYLEECLESIKNQTYTNIEVIMINDGSVDQSEAICNRFVSQDSRFTLISQRNMGVCVARNVGIKQAKGKFIIFADADDFYYENSIEKMVNLITRTNQKIALFNSDIETKDSTKKLLNLPNSDLSLFLPIRHYALWGYIFNSDLIKYNDIKFVPKLEFSEDRLFLYNLCFYSETMSISQESVYFHRANNSSMCNASSGIRKAKGQLYAAMELSKLIKRKDCNHVIFLNLKKEIQHVLRLSLLQYFSSTIKYSEIKDLYNIYTKNIGTRTSFIYNAIFQLIIAYKRKIL